jgi:hypothetical protein
LRTQALAAQDTLAVPTAASVSIRRTNMLQTFEAVLQPNGQLQFLDGPAGAAKAPRHVLVTFTDEAVRSDTALNGAALSEPALAQDWLRDEEEAAWAHLQPGK